METHFLENLKDYMVELFMNDPRIAALLEGKNFVRREEFNRVADELKEFRAEVNFRFEQSDARIQRLEKKVDDGFEEVDKRFEKLEQEMRDGFQAVDKRFEDMEQEIRTGFHNVQVHIDRLGSRWGIRNESSLKLQPARGQLSGSGF